MYTDLDKIDAATNLDNALCIQGFISKFPLEVQHSYVKFKTGSEVVSKPMSEVLNLFMVEERERMRELEQFQPSKTATVKDSNKPKCTYCNKIGHEEKTCFQKHGRQGGVNKSSNATTAGINMSSNCPYMFYSSQA